jgi:hypothetical protein
LNFDRRHDIAIDGGVGGVGYSRSKVFLLFHE